MKREEVIERAMSGEPLRWVSRSISGIRETDDHWEGKTRDCFLGRQRLTQEEMQIVIEMEIDGELVSEEDEHNRKSVIQMKVS